MSMIANPEDADEAPGTLEPCRESQPPLLARAARRLHAVRGAELGDGIGEVVAHGALAEPQPPGDGALGAPLPAQAQHLPLAVAQRVALRPRLARQLGIHRAAARVHP